MKLKMQVLNIDAEFKKLEAQRNKEIENNLSNTVNNLMSDLKEATPIDTGLARASWKQKKLSKEVIEIENTTEYIQYLNEGSSKQAPSRFIEKTALKYGTPLGTVVENRGN